MLEQQQTHCIHTCQSSLHYECVKPVGGVLIHQRLSRHLILGLLHKARSAHAPSPRRTLTRAVMERARSTNGMTFSGSYTPIDVRSTSVSNEKSCATPSERGNRTHSSTTTCPERIDGRLLEHGDVAGQPCCKTRPLSKRGCGQARTRKALPHCTKDCRSARSMIGTKPAPLCPRPEPHQLKGCLLRLASMQKTKRAQTPPQGATTKATTGAKEEPAATSLAAVAQKPNNQRKEHTRQTCLLTLEQCPQRPQARCAAVDRKLLRLAANTKQSRLDAR